MQFVNFILTPVILLLFPHENLCQLVVNVKNKGGDIDRESIQANTTADTVHLEYLSKDGTLVTQFIDYKSVCEHYFNHSNYAIAKFRFCKVILRCT